MLFDAERLKSSPFPSHMRSRQSWFEAPIHFAVQENWFGRCYVWISACVLFPV